MVSKIMIHRITSVRGPRVKCIEIHPTEEWILCALYTGVVVIWDMKLEKMINTFQVCDLPVRTAKFIARQSWIVTGSDDMMIRVYNYHTLANVHAFSAHLDYVRCIVVHPSKSCILSCSDDLSIKLWDWSRNWMCVQIFESHAHYIMQIVINPKDEMTFASASLDRTVKVWGIGNAEANFTLSGHERGVNCVDYCHSKDKPYIVAGADDYVVKVWDYQNRTCIHTLSGHTSNVTAVLFHPMLPLLLSASEDGSLKTWDTFLFNLDSSHGYGYERAWTICSMDRTNNIAIGYDEGIVLIKIGKERPAISMDENTGKVILTKNSEIQQVNLKTVPVVTEKDGEILPLAPKDMGACEIYPQSINHSQNGRFLTVHDGNEYIIYTSLALRTKSFGRAKQFVWGQNLSYAILNKSKSVTVFKNFEKFDKISLFDVEEIFGGRMLGVKTNLLSFYDWDKMDLITTIDIQPKDVFWSFDGERVCLTTDKSFYILNVKYEDEIVFELSAELNETVKSGLWINHCFVYTDSNLELRVCVEGATHNLARLEKEAFILGYVNEKNRLYLCDRETSITSYLVSSSILNYETAVLRRDVQLAKQLLPSLSEKCKPMVAHFLDRQGFKQEALELSTEPEHRFDLALSLGNLKIAEETAIVLNNSSSWSKLGCAAQTSNLQLANHCFEKAGHYAAVLLYAVSAGDRATLQHVAEKSKAECQRNVAFLANFLLSNVEECVQLLLDNGQTVEAALFARSYLPSKVPYVVKIWREELSRRNEKLASSIADPEKYSNLFPEYEGSLVSENVK